MPTTPVTAVGATAPTDDLLDTARALFPPPLRVDRVSAPHRLRGHAEHLVLPGPRAPRLCVPADNRRAAAESVLRFSSALPAHRILGRLAAASALAARVPPWPRHRMVVHGEDGEHLAQHLAEVLGQSVSFGFGIGSARVNRKPVLALFGADGRPLGFAKLGVGPFTDEQVEREARSLRIVQAVAIPGVATPRVVHVGGWRGHPLLVTTALRASPWATARRGHRIPLAQMADFARAFSPREADLAGSDWWRRLVRTVHDLPGGHARDELTCSLGRLESRWSDVPVPLGAWHGDWTPWNMGWAGRTLLLWDFERFDLGAPAGLDAFHHAVSGLPATGPAGPVLRALRGVSGRFPSPVGTLLAATYLAAIATRYQVAAGTAEGHLIEARAALMRRGLRRWLDETGGGR